MPKYRDYEWVMSCKVCKEVMGPWMGGAGRVYLRHWSSKDLELFTIITLILLGAPIIFILPLILYYSEANPRWAKYDGKPCPCCGAGGEWWEKISGRWVAGSLFLFESSYWQRSDEYRRLPGEALPGSLSIADDMKRKEHEAQRASL